MSSAASVRAVNRWSSRIIPAFLAGCIGFATYVVLKRICGMSPFLASSFHPSAYAWFSLTVSGRSGLLPKYAGPPRNSHRTASLFNHLSPPRYLHICTAATGHHLRPGPPADRANRGANKRSQTARGASDSGRRRGTTLRRWSG